MKLTPKQQRFVDEYLVDLNATQAAIRAGYTKRSARQVAARLLSKDDIAAAVRVARAKLSAKLEVTKERVVQELARIAFADIRNLFHWDEERACYVPSRELTEDHAAAISEIQAETTRRWEGHGDDAEPVDVIKLKIKTHDKKGALDSLCRVFGWQIQKHEVSGPNGGPIEHALQAPPTASLDEWAGIAARQQSQVLGAHANGNCKPHTNGTGSGRANGNGRG